MMQYTTVRQPQWASADREAIDCLVTFAALGEVPFTANPNDTAAHGREIFARAVAGDFGPVAEYVPRVATSQDSNGDGGEAQPVK